MHNTHNRKNHTDIDISYSKHLSSRNQHRRTNGTTQKKHLRAPERLKNNAINLEISIIYHFWQPSPPEILFFRLEYLFKSQLEAPQSLKTS